MEEICLVNSFRSQSKNLNHYEQCFLIAPKLPVSRKKIFFLEENIFQQRYLSSGCLGQFYDDRTSSMIEGHGNRNGFLVGVVREERERQ